MGAGVGEAAPLPPLPCARRWSEAEEGAGRVPGAKGTPRSVCAPPDGWKPAAGCCRAQSNAEPSLLPLARQNSVSVPDYRVFFLSNEIKTF